MTSEATAELQTAPVIAVEQITEGDVRCGYCSDWSVLTVATGADPSPEPVCIVHGRQYMDAAYRSLSAIFGPPGES